MAATAKHWVWQGTHTYVSYSLSSTSFSMCSVYLIIGISIKRWLWCLSQKSGIKNDESIALPITFQRNSVILSYKRLKQSPNYWIRMVFLRLVPRRFLWRIGVSSDNASNRIRKILNENSSKEQKTVSTIVTTAPYCLPQRTLNPWNGSRLH